MNIVFLGPPGAGKGTLASSVKDYLNVPHISTGQLFRDNIAQETELGKQVKAILASGGLVPDDVTIAMVRERLKDDDCKKGFILDGFPRTIPQADALAKMTKLDLVLNLQLSDKDIIERLSGRRVCPSNGNTYHILYNPPKVAGKDDVTGEDLIQRADDMPEAIAHRLEVYAAQTQPLIDYYSKQGLVRDVKASNKMTPDDVFEKAKEVLK